MGGAFVGVGDDASSTYWNPAGLALIKWHEISGYGTEWFAGMKFGQLAYAQPAGTLGSVGLSLSYLNLGTLTEVDEQGRFGDQFGASDVSVSAAWARAVAPGLRLGIAAKGVREEIDGENGLGGALDAGLLCDLRPRIRGGLSIRNVGPGFRIGGGEVQPLPLLGTVGGSVQLLSPELLVATDYTLARDNSGYFATGIEWRAFDILALRAGYRTGTATGDAFSAGVGLEYRSFQDYFLDYAFTDRDNLGGLHFLSAGMRF